MCVCVCFIRHEDSQLLVCVHVFVSGLPAVDVILVPRRGLVELDLGVVSERRVDQAGDGLLEGVIEDGAGLTLEALALGGEGGLGVV